MSQRAAACSSSAAARPLAVPPLLRSKVMDDQQDTIKRTSPDAGPDPVRGTAGADCSRPASSAARLLLLGAAQDAGVPQCGCHCTNCSAVRQGVMARQYAVSAALLDDTDKTVWLLDCTPDFKEQYDLLQRQAPEYKLEGVLLTHLHSGHYMGLIQFGREMMDWRGLKVVASKSICSFLQSNEPWATYIRNGNFVLSELAPTSLQHTASVHSSSSSNATYRLSSNLEVEAVHVPHRAEYSDCVAYRVLAASGRSAFYCPDIDSWREWEQSTGVEPVAWAARTHTFAFLDASFFSGEELPGRDITLIPHPLVQDTLLRLEAARPWRAESVVLQHMNHSNPVYRDTPARRACLQAGVVLGEQGMVFDL